jgi:hypothetical protein
MARVDPPIPSDDAALLSGLKAPVRAARLTAAAAVNRELVQLYWSIGRDILERPARGGWGAKVLDRLGVDLRPVPGHDRPFAPKQHW